MLSLEIKKNIKSIPFIVSVILLYIVFMLGDSGQVLPGDISTTVAGAIWNKFQGNWQICSDSSYLLRMKHIWSDNSYLPVLLPFLCGMPSAINYLEEIRTGNLRMILSRCSLRQYYIAKLGANLLSAVLVSVLAIFCYYITLILFFDNIPPSNESFPIIYFAFSGNLVEDGSEAVLSVIYFRLLKEVLYFFLYSVIGASFCFWMAVWCGDQYTVFGGTVFLSYLQWRITEELLRKYINEGSVWTGVAGEIINPIFLHYAGESGFYQNKECLAVGIALLLILLNYGIAVLLSKNRFDVSGQ